MSDTSIPGLTFASVVYQDAGALDPVQAAGNPTTRRTGRVR
jgi:hypothetical protein